jgi:hypothetical protein
VRGPPETATEYAVHAARAVPEAAPPFAGLTRTYEAVRFGGHEVGEPERAAADGAAAGVEEAVATRRRAARGEGASPG